jgi:hypothetical protein
MTMLHLIAGLMPKSLSLTWTFVGSCQSTGSSLDFSALSAGTRQANDVALFFDQANQGSTPTAVTPSGFTNIVNSSGGSSPLARAMVSWKKLTGSEASVTGMNGGASDSKIGLVFRPSINFTTLTVSTPQNSGIIDTNPAAITVNPSAETIPVVLLGVGAVYQGNVTFSTASPAFDAEINLTNNDMRVGYKIYNSSPLSHSIDINDLGDNNWLCGFYFKAI